MVFLVIEIKTRAVEIEDPGAKPELYPHAKRFVETIRHECLNHFVLFGERHLRYYDAHLGEVIP